jgi:hypothetical protein
MIHIELHTLDTSEDALTAEELGLIEIKTDEFCETCGERVAFDTDGSWISCTILLTDIDNDEYVYLLCDDCTEPTLAPLELDEGSSF